MSKSLQSQSLENYLSQIEWELRDLPSQARADELREIEAHLQTMIEACDDVAGVLAQFGKPRRIGRDLRRAWERKQPESWWRVVLAIIVGFATQTVLGLFLGSLIAIGSYFSLDTKLASISPAFSSYYFVVFLVFLLSAIPSIVTGFSVGAVSPKRGVWITCLYHVSLIVMLLLQSFQFGFPNFDNPSSLAFDSLWFIGGSFFLTLLLSIYGVQLGTRNSKRLLSRITISTGLQ